MQVCWLQHRSLIVCLSDVDLALISGTTSSIGLMRGALRLVRRYALRLTLVLGCVVRLMQSGITVQLRAACEGLLQGRAPGGCSIRQGWALMLGWWEPGVGASLGGAGCRPIRGLTGKAVICFWVMRLCWRLCQRGRQLSPIGLRVERLGWNRWGYEVGEGGGHIGVPFRWVKVGGLGTSMAGAVMSLHLIQQEWGLEQGT